MINNYDIYIFDYEGTLSENPSKKLSLKELLYEFDFRCLSPNKKIYDLANSLNNKEIYVVGVIEANTEIDQKYEWLKLNYPMIKKENCIFISGDHKKSEVISAIIAQNNYDKDKIIFIDDKKKHIEDVTMLGIKTILVENVK